MYESSLAVGAMSRDLWRARLVEGSLIEEIARVLLRALLEVLLIGIRVEDMAALIEGGTDRVG